jgi:cysteine desulfurase
MHEILKGNFANPGSIHEMGIGATKILEQSRGEVAKILGAHNDEIVFTSGATESNNLAIFGVTKFFSECFLKSIAQAGEPSIAKIQQNFMCGFQKTAQKKIGNLPHIVTTNIEHSSVLETCKYLEKTKQAEVTYVPVEGSGIVDSRKIKKAIKQNTVLISVMYANNEIGTIQPIIEIAKEVRHYNKKNLKKIIFHTDATQAINYLPIKVEKLGIDLMSFNSGKIYGPKGVGVLYIKRKTPISKIMYGGDQELGLRPGTENISAVIGLTEALKITEKIKDKEIKRLTKLRDYFIKKLQSFYFSVNGELKNRLPNNINITIPKIPSDLLLLELSVRGIYVSEKSACKSGDKAGSYVIRALHQNLSNPKICKKIDGSLRFSLGRQSTKADVDYTIKSLSEILLKLNKWYN